MAALAVLRPPAQIKTRLGESALIEINRRKALASHMNTSEAQSLRRSPARRRPTRGASGGDTQLHRPGVWHIVYQR
jgi:hypothetical protein